MSGKKQGANHNSPKRFAASKDIHARLVAPALWQETLTRYAVATNLAVVLTDSVGRQLGECVNPQPTWSLLHQPNSADRCPFSLLTAKPCPCVADALATCSFRMARDQT